MQIQRKSIICTSIICVATLILSIFVTINVTRFLDNWFVFLLSLIISIFASSLLVLSNSLLSYSVTRKNTSGDSIQLFCEIFEEYANTTLYLQDTLLNSSGVKLYKNQIDLIDTKVLSMIKLFKRIIAAERIAWPRPSFCVRYALKHQNSLYSIETKVLMHCVNALKACSNCHVCLKEIRFLEGDRQNQAIQTFVENWKKFQDAFKKGEGLDILFEPYNDLLRKI